MVVATSVQSIEALQGAPSATLWMSLTHISYDIVSPRLRGVAGGYLEILGKIDRNHGGEDDKAHCGSQNYPTRVLLQPELAQPVPCFVETRVKLLLFFSYNIQLFKSKINYS